MALSEYQKEQILSFSGKMSADEIAKKVGVGRATVFRVLKESADREQGRAVSKTVSKVAKTPARVPARDKEDSIKTVSKSVSKIDTVVLSPESIAQVELKRLLSELALYDQALAEQSSEDEKTRSMAEWKLINHDKQMQGHVRIISQWFGMDKGDVLKAIEEIRNDPLAGMTKDQLLALYKVTQ